MLWCATCCEPYHSFCLHPDDLPLSFDGSCGKPLQDWICRRCSLCKVCGEPGDVRRADTMEGETVDDEMIDSSEDESDGNIKRRKNKKRKIDAQLIKRERLRCKGCSGTFHSDCLLPSQQKMIKAQGSQWVSLNLVCVSNLSSSRSGQCIVE